MPHKYCAKCGKAVDDQLLQCPDCESIEFLFSPLDNTEVVSKHETSGDLKSDHSTLYMMIFAFLFFFVLIGGGCIRLMNYRGP